ncbi:uncharacterized protein TNCV_4970761 [Trichonephila clavipes]|nr:uncharacterized protein TNCV_4970761 [Trichonephila clavipes]
MESSWQLYSNGHGPELLAAVAESRRRSFPPCKKAEVKALVNAKLFSNREISPRLKVSEASVRRIKKKIESGEELIPKRKKKCCRKPIFNPRSERSLKKICLENRFATTKVIKSQLQDINVNASERTVRRKIKDLNFMTCRLARKPMFNPCNESKASELGQTVCFSDESTFEILQNKAQFVCRRRGEKFHSDCVFQTVKHPTKIMISSVISGKGTGCLYVVEGMMRQDQYRYVLQNRLISQLEE